MLTDRHLTTLQETGAVTIDNFETTIGEIVEALDTLGIDPKNVLLDGDIEGYPVLSVLS